MNLKIYAQLYHVDKYLTEYAKFKFKLCRYTAVLIEVRLHF